MKVLITGANGFIGKNLCLALKNQGIEYFGYDADQTIDELRSMIKEIDCIVHLAGINRPLTNKEFYDGNTNFTVKLIELIKESKRIIPVLFSSSTQAALENDYGRSKRMAENSLYDFMEENNNPVVIYRLTNVFGRWCRPNYNSVVATFCHNITHDLPVEIWDPNFLINLIYIDDVVKEFIHCLKSTIIDKGRVFSEVSPSYPITVGQLAEKLLNFRKTRQTIFTPKIDNDFDKKMYATFLSYYDKNNFSYDLTSNIDGRGSFTEILKTLNDGQVSVNISKPGITKGNHYHNTKNEKFIVVSGECEIKFRKIGTTEIITYLVDGSKMQVVDIPPGYTHSIKNIGTTDSVTIMWASELFDKNNPDTFFEEVEKNA